MTGLSDSEPATGRGSSTFTLCAALVASVCSRGRLAAYHWNRYDISANCVTHERSPTRFSAPAAGADVLGDQICRQPVSLGIPVAIAEIASESMQENFVLIGVALHRRGQIQEIDLLAIGQRFQSQVRIETCVGPDVLKKSLAHVLIRINLNRVAQGDEQELAPFSFTSSRVR